jgi:flavin reductase (DIM6/NTAB) family NADH-FMN oxidoreductase RutF
MARAVFGENSPLPLATGEPVDKATFFAIMSAFPSGVAIVTTIDEDGRPKGLTCTATCSLSAEPPLLLVCVDRKSSTLPAVRHTRRFVVNYLLAGRGELSNRFASREQERWTDVAWRPTPCGLPCLHADSLAYAECSLVQEVDAGDHVILIGRVDGGQAPAPGTQPLMYFRRGYGTWVS